MRLYTKSVGLCVTLEKKGGLLKLLSIDEESCPPNILWFDLMDVSAL